MIRPAVVSGQFYASDPDDLAKDVKRLLNAASIDGKITESVKNPFAFVVPHAGYVYSGLTAAHAYKMMPRYGFDTVILLGPSHNGFIKGNSVFPKGVFETPLGNVEIDAEISSFLSKKDGMDPSFEFP
jgi:AmmeMemoRadiSam system protein B